MLPLCKKNIILKIIFFITILIKGKINKIIHRKGYKKPEH